MKAIGLFLSCSLMAGCLDNATQTLDRSKLLNSSGPQFSVAEIDSYRIAVQNMRRFYRGIGNDGNQATLNTPIAKTNYVEARANLFAYIDHRCDAYIDAIFWAHRTRGAATSTNNAVSTATAGIVGATGGSVKALTILAAAFGLNGSLFDAYYDSVLYGLNPSGVQNLINEARRLYRASDTLSNEIASEGVLLLQVQGYMRLCTPATIEYLVNDSIAKAKLVDATKGENVAKPGEGAASPEALSSAPAATENNGNESGQTSTSVPVIEVKQN